jgi:hypothetical protein
MTQINADGRNSMSDTPKTESQIKEDEVEQLHIRYGRMIQHARGLERANAKLGEALRDAISTYGDKPEILVTADRVEMWQHILDTQG